MELLPEMQIREILMNLIFGFGLGDLLNLGTLGSIFFLLSWILQVYESRKIGKSVVGLKFWLLRLVGTVFVLIYTIQIRVLIFILVDIATLMLIIYNIILISKTQIAIKLEDYINKLYQW